LKILSPLNNLDEVEELIRAGADELYCGVLPREWPYATISINRRQEKNASFQAFQELADCVRIAHSHQVPIFLALNEHYYTNDQYPTILEYVDKALEADVDALMVTDIGLLLALKRKGITAEIHISTGGTTFNSECAKFYEDLGAKRIVLPRHLTVNEIREIVEGVPELEAEVFILNSKCPNIDGFCTFHHGLMAVVDEGEKRYYRNACMLPHYISVDDEIDGFLKEKIPWERQCIWQSVHLDKRPCGACALMDFEEIGVASVKIVGRGNSLEKKIADIHFIKACLDFLEGKPQKPEYIEKTQRLYQFTYGYPCRIYMCYYPYLA
jgi:putative protease